MSFLSPEARHDLQIIPWPYSLSADMGICGTFGMAGMATRVGGTAEEEGDMLAEVGHAQGREGGVLLHFYLSFAPRATVMFTCSPLHTELPEPPCLLCGMDYVCPLNCEPSTLLQVTSVSHSVAVTGNNRHYCLCTRSIKATLPMKSLSSWRRLEGIAGAKML